MDDMLELDRPVFVVISGTIAAGKSTLTDALAARIRSCIALHEPVADNPYLADFYRDMPRHAFGMQMYLLEARFRQHRLAVATLLDGRSVIQDRSIYEDTAFAEAMHEAGHIDDRDWRTYLRFFESYAVEMQRPDLLIYLDISPATALDRVMRRSRESEVGRIDLGYLERLREAYERWIVQTHKHLPIFRLRREEFPDVDEVLGLIFEERSENMRFHERWARPHI
jgi:hypothetical protein